MACRMTFVTVQSDSRDLLINPVNAADQELPGGFFDIPVGQTSAARMKLNFDDPSGRSLLWTVRFNPGLYPGSTHVTVTRLTASEWMVEAATADRARLIAADSKGRIVSTDEGLYVMPFRLRVVRP